MNAERRMQNGQADEGLGLTRKLNTVLPSARSRHATARGQAAKRPACRFAVVVGPQILCEYSGISDTREFEAWSLGQGAWSGREVMNAERRMQNGGALSLEHGAWSKEHGGER